MIEERKEEIQDNVSNATVSDLMNALAESQKKQTELLALLTEDKKGKESQSKNVPQESTVEINILEVLWLMLKRWWIIALAALVFGAAAFCVSYAMYVPSYQATVKMYVNNASQSSDTTKLTTSDLSASQALVKTYGQFLKTNNVLDKVESELEGYGYEPRSYETLLKKIQCGALESTEIFYVTVSDPDPQFAIDMANAIASTLPGQIAELMEGSSARIVDRAKVAKLAGSGLARKTIIFALVGAVLACGVLFVVEYLLSDTIEDENWFTANFDDIPFLGDVPDSNETHNHHYGYKKYGYYRKSESTEG